MEISIENITWLIRTHQFEISLGLCILFLAYILPIKTKKKNNGHFPPGPKGLPIVGYLPFLTQDLHLDFMELGKKYGDVFSVRIGSQDIVVLHGAEVITESLNKLAFQGRPPNIGVGKLMPSSMFVGNNFTAWKEQRKFMVQSIKGLGLGKTKIEDTVKDGISHFMEFLRSHKSRPIDVKKILSLSLSNNMNYLIFGKRYGFDDQESHFLATKIEEIFENILMASLDLAFPWIHYIPLASKILSSSKAKSASEECRLFLNKQMKEHMKSIDSAHVRDFMDRYLLEIATQKAKNPNTTFNHNMLIRNALDFSMAGYGTVLATMLWIIYVIAAFPDVQERIQQEIMEVIGLERNPEHMDLKNMPYTHAVILEVMRWKTIVPLNIMHYTLDDVLVAGYHIPKGTTVFCNSWAVHNDSRYWDEPQKFKPERFFNKDGKSNAKTKYFMGFSKGARACLGESIALLETFLYLTSILQEFNIAFPDGTKPTFEAKFIILYRLEPYLVRFIPKNPERYRK